MPKKENLIGKVVGRLTVVALLDDLNKAKQRQWLCNCTCGNTHIVTTSTFNGGKTTSCGCYARELSAERIRQLAKHGLSRTKVYRAWQDAKSRCYDQTHKEYERYGAKGIYMSDEFLNNPVAWCDYLGNPPDDTPRKWSVDRIDPNKGYERGNLRWADAGTQARNHKKAKNNTSGETGVTWYVDAHNNTRAIAWWNVEGKSKSKSFSVKEHGLMEAYALAVAYRRKMLEKMTEDGIEYSKHHGK